MDERVIPLAPAEQTEFGNSKCGRCTSSKCCTYITQAIDTPRSKRDFDHLLWQVSHRNVHVYKEKAGWYLLVQTPCTHLMRDGRCGVYETRPQICRDYRNDYCEFDGCAEEGFDLYFENYQSLLAYCMRRFKRWGA